jgi:hypothetical protein
LWGSLEEIKAAADAAALERQRNWENIQKLKQVQPNKVCEAADFIVFNFDLSPCINFH